MVGAVDKMKVHVRVENELGLGRPDDSLNDIGSLLFTNRLGES